VNTPRPRQKRILSSLVQGDLIWEVRHTTIPGKATCFDRHKPECPSGRKTGKYPLLSQAPWQRSGQHSLICPTGLPKVSGTNAMRACQNIGLYPQFRQAAKTMFRFAQGEGQAKVLPLACCTRRTQSAFLSSRALSYKGSSSIAHGGARCISWELE
jgi:hypothetical protein